MNKVNVNESVELPIFSGTIEVDTTNYCVTIFMKEGPIDSILTITKITNDNNVISLFSEKCLINGADITIFGVSSHAKVKKGKINTLVLKSDGKNWNIINEY
jgi:hypothetical protein